MEKRVKFSEENFPRFPRVASKRSEWRYYLVSLILGIIILGLAFYMIFNEFFTDDDLEWEACRQSVVLRNTVPASDDFKKLTLEQLKNQFPLKCKNDVVDVDFITQEKIMETIASEMLKCWYLYGEGQYSIFPRNFIEQKKTCSICSRIHFSGESLRQGEFNMARYLYTHTLKFKEIPSNLIPQEGVHPDSIMAKLNFYYNYKNNSLFRFPDENDLKEMNYNWGSRVLINPEKGDLLIGYFDYSNNEYLEWGQPPWVATSYQSRYIFYAQPSVDNLDCSIESIPA